MPSDHFQTFVSASHSFHNQIREAIENTDIYPRRNVELDSVLLALLNRSLNCMNTLVTVCDLQDGATASVLARVIVEIWIVTRWITNRDSYDRAHKFTYFEAKGIERAIEVVQTHDPGLLVPADPNQTFLTQAASLYNSHVHWAGSVKSMAEEKEEIDLSLTNPKYF